MLYRLHFKEQPDYEHYPPITPLPNCIEIVVNCNQGTNGVETCLRFTPNVHTITLSSSTVDTSTANKLNPLKQLQSLRLSHCTITTTQGIRSDSLTTLTLAYTPISENNLDHLLTGMPNLKSISLAPKLKNRKQLEKLAASCRPDIKML